MPAAQDEGAKLREVSEEELKQILAAHKTWLEPQGEEGKQADLFRTNLQEADLRGANLQEADLTNANLQGADLFSANLQGAQLGDANLQEAYFTNANLQGADLRGANLQGAHLDFAKNVIREQLDKACGDDKTTLPDYLADYQIKAQLEQ